MAKPSLIRPFFSTLFTLVGLLLLHLGCFIFSASGHHDDDQPHQHSARHNKKFLSSSHRIKRATTGAVSASWSFVKRLFHCTGGHGGAGEGAIRPEPHPSAPSPCSSSRSLTKPIVIPLASPEKLSQDPHLRPESDICSDPQPDFPLRNNIYPCTLCGEIFLSANLLEHHRFIKHAVSELQDGDSGHNIVQIIFKTGWPGNAKKNPVVNRILKIHNSPKILTRFEEYRECVKSRAARDDVVGRRRRDERCIADGNELLRFHCATFLCGLGQNGNSSICSQQFCGVCGIIRGGFSAKMDGIPTQSSGWRAHVAVPEEIEEEFKFMHVKRAMLVCRVIAGRIGSDPDVVDKEDPGFDSLVGRENGAHPCRLDEEEELWVFNPRAVLPCFVIVYNG